MTETISTIVESQRQQFVAVATSKANDLNFDREAQFALQILGEPDSYLHKVAMANKSSLMAAITNVAAIGISLNPASKLAYLVPRKGKICLDISYMGLMHLAQITGAIKWGQAEIVKGNDTFQLQGVDKAPIHTFNPFNTDRGEISGAYVVVKTDEGDYLTHAMPIDEIFAIRDRSEAYKKGKSGPWATDEGEMIKKTVIKQASKYWPKRERLDDAVHYLNETSNEGINFEKEVKAEVVTEDGETIKGAQHTPTDGTLAALPANVQDEAYAIAITINELLDEGFEWKAFDKYDQEQNLELREAVWVSLGSRTTDVNGKQIRCRSILTKCKAMVDDGQRPAAGD